MAQIYGSFVLHNHNFRLSLCYNLLATILIWAFLTIDVYFLFLCLSLSECSCLMISQKREHYFKSNSSCKSKGNVYILKLKFYLKSRSATYFFKTVLNKASVWSMMQLMYWLTCINVHSVIPDRKKKALLIFAFTVFLAVSLHSSRIDFIMFNPLSANPMKWSNTLKLFVGKLLTNCLSVFDHFVKFALKGLVFLTNRCKTYDK